jgi:hypothetical protein
MAQDTRCLLTAEGAENAEENGKILGPQNRGIGDRGRVLSTDVWNGLNGNRPG